MNGQDLGNLFGGFGAFALALIVVFLIGREFFCWYWKINRMVLLLSDIRTLLTQQQQLSAVPPSIDAGGSTSSSQAAMTVPRDSPQPAASAS